VGRHSNHKCTVAPVITSIQGIGQQARRSCNTTTGRNRGVDERSGRMRGQEGASCGSSNGASGQNREVGEGRIANRLATTEKRAIARAFGTTTRPSGTVMLLTKAFPTRGTSPASRGLLRPRERHCNADRERSEKLSDRAKC